MAECPSSTPDSLTGDPIRLHVRDIKWIVVDMDQVIPGDAVLEADDLEVSYWEWVGAEWVPADEYFRDPTPEIFEDRSVRFRLGEADDETAAPANRMLAVAVEVLDSGGGRTYSTHRLELSWMATTVGGGI